VNKMHFRQFQYSEGGFPSKAAVIAAAVLGSGCHANIHEHVADIGGACCADVKRKYRQHALEHHSDKHGCPENFYKLTNAKEKALKTCNPCSHNSDKKHTRTKYSQRPTSSKKKAKKRRKAQRREEKAKRREEKAKRREPKPKPRQHKQRREKGREGKAKRREPKPKPRQHKQRREKDGNHETKVSATTAAMVVGGFVVESGGPEKQKKTTLRQTSTGRN